MIWTRIFAEKAGYTGKKTKNFLAKAQSRKERN
jgi:hypothetical protein